MRGGPDPCAVVLWLDDGTTVEHIFATRFLAELFISFIPGAQTMMPEDEEWARVRAAMLSPLVVEVLDSTCE